MIYRCVLAKWAMEEFPDRRRVYEGEFSDERIKELNRLHYHIYWLPNHPSLYEKGVKVDGSQIDVFRFVFVDMDMKDGKWASKEEFVEALLALTIAPSFIVDSGNGIHAYWEVSDLDAMSYLKLQRRLCRSLVTDEAVAKIYQLLRVPNTVNPKHKGEFKNCELIYTSEKIYTCEELDSQLPQITMDDEEYCKSHHDKTYRLAGEVTVDDKLPVKFATLLSRNPEVKELWIGEVDDRSKADYRLGHILFAAGLTKKEAMSTLINTRKALERAPIHRVAYAEGIVEKIWTFEMETEDNKLELSSTVKEILERSGDTLKGIPFRCWSHFDATHHGFRLGQIIGLVAGSGVGKTAVALNMFMGFVENNPDYEHFFVPLEQPANEIADRWKTMCGDRTQLYEKVHVLSNYDAQGGYRNLSLSEIKDYIMKFQEVTKKKVGCIVIDHIGALKKKNAAEENQGIMDICHEMKAFAVETNTMLVMQSQAPREKAGIGDLELNKDAAYGTVFFESYCDYVITLWQPLKRCYNEEGCPTVTAYKFCKIRHKKKHLDQIQEDVRYLLMFDPATERLREMTQPEVENSFKFWNNKATNLRKQNSKTDLLVYTRITWGEGEKQDGTKGRAASNQAPG